MSALSLSAADRSRLGSGGEAELARTLSVFTGAGAPPPGTSAIAGTYVLDAEGLHFRPLFPFVSGLRYTVRLELGGGRHLVESFEVASPAGPAPRVVAVFPSGPTLPENTLRAYLHFSQAMDTAHAHRFVRLEREGGAVVPLAFVEVQHGLWDPGRTRLTLLFHPGRTKRGVAPGERLGPPLREGERYRVVVDAAMRDVAGRPLGRDFEWRFAAGAPDREPPRAEDLRVEAPRTPETPLVVELPEPLDEALLRRLVWVEDARGRRLPGTTDVTAGETRWCFRPEEPWAAGRYVFRLHPALEDRTGNRFDRPFERAPGALAAGGDTDEPLSFAFSVPAAP